MNSKRKIIVLSVLIILIAIVSGVSVAYAYWSKTIVSENSNIVRSGCLNIEYSDLSSPITLDRTYPGFVPSCDLEDGECNDGYVFSVHNTCSNELSYDVNLETLDGSNLSPSYLRVRLSGYSTGQKVINTIDDITSYNSFISLPSLATLNTFEYVSPTLENSIYSNRLLSYNIGANETHVYVLKTYLINYPFATSEMQEKSWNGKVSVTSSYDYNYVPISGSLLREDVFANELSSESITAIKPYDGVPSPELLENATIISESGYDPTFAWIDGSILYYYSKSKNIYMVSDKFGDPGDDWPTNYENVEYLDLSRINTSKMNSMRGFFRGMDNLKYLDISSFDTSNVTDMSYMFRGVGLTNLDLSNFDTSNVTNMAYMFHSVDVTNLNLSNFNTSNVTDMKMMFAYSSIEELNLSSFNTSNVKNMYWMFCKCNDLKSLDVTMFDTGKVSNMSHMFSGCSSLTELDLTNFNTSKVENMQDMFGDCTSLTVLDLSSFDTTNVTLSSLSSWSGAGMFPGTDNLTTIIVDCDKGSVIKQHVERSYSSKTIICSNE